MISMFKSTNEIIGQIEEFFTLVDESSLLYEEATRFYLKGDLENFLKITGKVREKESKADELRRSVEDSLYRKSLLPEFRGDVLQLLERLDDLIDTAKENLIQFEVESPHIPQQIHDLYLELTRTSVKSVESVVLSARTFFRDPRSVKDLLHRVYFYEKEGDQFSNMIKKMVYREMTDLDLSQKNHIRHFIDKTEHISDIAEGIADLLAILSIKRSI
jgi:predicted phosphate transport protein (TIGR00153 family)